MLSFFADQAKMNRYLCICALNAALIVLSGCGANEHYGRDLVLVKENPSRIFLTRRGYPFDKIIIEEQIVDVVHQDGVLLVLRKVAKNYDCEDIKGGSTGSLTIVTNYTDVSEYWIVGDSGQDLFGPMNELKFTEAVAQRGIRLKRPLREGSYRSNTAAFENDTIKCKSLKKF